MSRKKTLYWKIRTDQVIRKAWHDIRNKSVVSASKEIQREAISFEQEIEKNLKRIKRKLLEKKYSFSSVKATPKRKKGKESNPRPVVLASITDRIVQRAILIVLRDLVPIKKLIDNPFSFGCIKDKNVSDAISVVRNRIEKGAQYYVVSDIAGFFTRIPRTTALQIVNSHLPDNSLDCILEEATRVEISNSHVLEMYPDIYPTYERGVGQGLSLSPFLGNMLLHEFDLAMNEGPCTCLRYVDDLIILGPKATNVNRAFRKAQSLLSKFSMELYEPRNSKKASEGETRKKFDYLGCTFTKDGVFPNKDSRTRLKEKIQSMLLKGNQFLSTVKRTSPENTKESFSGVLYGVNLSVRSWADHYSFCTKMDIFDQMDDQISELIYSFFERLVKESRELDRELIGKALGVTSISGRVKRKKNK